MSGLEIIVEKIRYGKTVFEQWQDSTSQNKLTQPIELNAEDLLDVFTRTQAAKRQWENACAFFNEAAGQDLVEQAIYELIAAEYKYGYFLKLSKTQNIRNGGVPYDV